MSIPDRSINVEGIWVSAAGLRHAFPLVEPHGADLTHDHLALYIGDARARRDYGPTASTMVAPDGWDQDRSGAVTAECYKVSILTPLEEYRCWTEEEQFFMAIETSAVLNARALLAASATETVRRRSELGDSELEPGRLTRLAQAQMRHRLRHAGDLVYRHDGRQPGQRLARR